MPVVSIGEYIGTPLDAEKNFNGNLLVYVRWNDHQLFAGPFCLSLTPTQTFREFIGNVLSSIIAPHPDASAIGWDKVEWTKSDLPWKPNFDDTLTDNQIAHKELLAFTTPGLKGYKGTGV